MNKLKLLQRKEIDIRTDRNKKKCLVFLQNQNTWQTIGHFQSLIDRMSSSAQSEISDCEEILTKYYQTMAYYDEVAALATQRP